MVVWAAVVAFVWSTIFRTVLSTSELGSPGWVYYYSFPGDRCSGLVNTVIAVSTGYCHVTYNNQGVPLGSILYTCSDGVVTSQSYQDKLCNTRMLESNVTSVGCVTEASTGSWEQGFMRSYYVGCSTNENVLPLPAGQVYTVFSAYSDGLCSSLSYIIAYLNNYCFSYSCFYTNQPSIQPTGQPSTLTSVPSSFPPIMQNSTHENSSHPTYQPSKAPSICSTSGTGSLLYQLPYVFTYSDVNCSAEAFLARSELDDDGCTSSQQPPFSAQPYWYFAEVSALFQQLIQTSAAWKYYQETGIVDTPNYFPEDNNDHFSNANALGVGLAISCGFVVFMSTIIYIGFLVYIINKVPVEKEKQSDETTELLIDNFCKFYDDFIDYDIPLKTKIKVEMELLYHQAKEEKPSAEDIANSGKVEMEFLYHQAKEEKPSAEDIANYLMEYETTDSELVLICIPCYDEDDVELQNTIFTILKNIAFMKFDVLFHKDYAGKKLAKRFKNITPVFVPIFDGALKLHPKMHSWLNNKFHGLITPALLEKIPDNTDPLDHDVFVRMQLRKWKFYTHKKQPESKEFEFFMLPVVKRINLRKHDSHEWFLRSICKAFTTDKLKTILMTDCSTIFADYWCLARLFSELYLREDLIGTTARQRVARSSQYYRPCEYCSDWFRSNHDSNKFTKAYSCGKPGRNPCFRCFLAFWLSPAPIQGYEFEATLVLNSAMFNLIEALPVMPGPCQLFNYEKIRDCNIDDMYFDFLLKPEIDLDELISPSSSTSNIRTTIVNTTTKAINQENGESKVEEHTYSPFTALSSRPPTDISIEQTFIDQEKGETQVISNQKETIQDSTEDHVSASSSASCSKSTTVRDPNDLEQGETQGTTETNNNFCCSRLTDFYSRLTGPLSKQFKRKNSLEILRVEVRSAEDRLLSFAAVFGSGEGVKWVPGAAFYYIPEVTWDKLLKQRRRWINGTFASFLFFFLSERAARKVLGGFHDQYRISKSSRIVQMFWGLQLYQLVVVILGPAIFGSAVYIGMKDCERLLPGTFGWLAHPVFSHEIEILTEIRVMELFTIIFMLVYGWWMNISFYYETIYEWISIVMAWFGFLSVLPIHIAVWYSVFFLGFTGIPALVVGSLLLPIVLALAQSATSAKYYCLYLPHFLALIIPYLMYIPAYSFARVWDTKWGNRAGTRDSNLTTEEENMLKFYNWIFINFSVIINFFAVWGIVKIVHNNNTAVLILMFLAFLPVFVQLLCSTFYLFIFQLYSSYQIRGSSQKKEKKE